MGSIRFERLGRWGIGALMLLLFHGLGTPRSAWAGCNHLVSSRSGRLLDFNRLDALIASGSSATLLAEDPLREEQGPKHPAPCSGPGCSSRVPMPVPTSLSDSDRSDQWGNLSTLAILTIASP
ncbi:MAG: hypothetical protein ACHRXM_40350, partial [Isosphaerales bacterium]